MSAIVVNGLTKRFSERAAVEDVSFRVERGEVFGFLGPNGAGKTTTVRMLTTVLRPTAGDAEVAGMPVRPDTGPELRRRIGVMSENPGLYLKLSVEENLQFFAGLYGVPAPEQRIAQALEAMGLSERRADPAGSLSKGLRQRTALARALLPEPEVLFLDEPTSGLDPEASLEVRDLIDSLRRRGMTVFLTTHRLEEAERLCDRVGIINTRLVTVGPTAELRRPRGGLMVELRLRSPLADPQLVLAEVAGVEGWEEVSGPQDTRYNLRVADLERVVPEVVRAVVGAGGDVLAVTEVTRTLEDVYLELVGEGRR